MRLPYFSEPSHQLFTEAKRLVSSLLHDKYFSPTSIATFDYLVQFASVRRIYSVIFIGTRYSQDRYPTKLSRELWWPWVEYVIFESATGRWWTDASGLTSRLRFHHNALVSYIYGSHSAVPIHLPGTTYVVNADAREAVVAKNAPVFLTRFEMGSNYPTKPIDELRSKPHPTALFIDYTDAFKGSSKIRLVDIDREEVEVLWDGWRIQQ